MALDVIYEAPAHLLLSERLLLYALVSGLRPNYCLEIGTFRGGSALIICAAMDEIDHGKLICVDPAPKIAPEHWARIAHRTLLIEGSSPDALAQAYRLAGSRFDFVFIDGDHSYEAVLKDIEGTIAFLDDEGYILFHDAHYFEVKEAIDEALRRYPFLVDCNILSKEANPTNNFWKGKQIVWGGLRLLRASLLRAYPNVQTHMLRLFLSRLRTLYNDVLYRLSRRLHIVAIGPFYRQTNGHSVAFGQEAPFGALLAPVAGVSAGIFPAQRGFGHRPVHTQPFPLNPFQLIKPLHSDCFGFASQ